MHFAYCIMIEIDNRNILCWWHIVLRAAFICHMAVLGLLESAVQMVGEHIKTEEQNMPTQLPTEYSRTNV